jgi:hypothetical protein
MTDLSNVVWLRSSSCSGNNCLEVAFVNNQVAVRDSKDSHGPVLMFTSSEWRAFLHDVRNGEFDLGQR